MPKNIPAPWQELELQAYHAYREWPIWLVLRERELAAHLRERKKPIAPDAAKPGTPSAQPTGDPSLAERREHNRKGGKP